MLPINKTAIAELSAKWLDAKESERLATEQRRAIEDAIKAALAVTDSFEGTETLDADAYTVKLTGRIDRKVDATLVQEIAAEHGLTDHLGTLFRWKPEINAKAWKDADASITAPLLAAITSKPGRPSFAIVAKESA